MQNFQDTFETRKRSFISVFSNLLDCTFCIAANLSVLHVSGDLGHTSVDKLKIKKKLF